VVMLHTKIHHVDREIDFIGEVTLSKRHPGTSHPLTSPCPLSCLAWRCQLSPRWSLSCSSWPCLLAPPRALPARRGPPPTCARFAKPLATLPEHARAKPPRPWAPP
jgi:hypothetical protein